MGVMPHGDGRPQATAKEMKNTYVDVMSHGGEKPPPTQEARKSKTTSEKPLDNSKTEAKKRQDNKHKQYTLMKCS